MRLVRAHVDVAQAEFSEIADEIKRFALAAGISFAALLFAGLLLSVGGTLFVGEWLFGSLGWGVLHGLELSIAISVVAIAAVLGATRRQIARSILMGLLTAIVVGAVLGLDLTNQGWTRLGESFLTGIEPGVRPLAVAVLAAGAALAVLGLLVGARKGGVGGAIGGLVAGVLLGVVIGALTAIRWGPQAGAGVGVALGLGLCPALLGLSVARQGVDFDAIKARLWPDETIQISRETIEWVREQTPLGRKS